MEIIYLSTVTPVYRGAETLRDLAIELDKFRQELIASSSPLRLTESIFVDDGSVDGSDAVLNELREKYDWLQVIQLSRNFGQHPATMSGILHSSGDWIATLDEDLQHHPKFILKLIKQAIIQRQDIVYAHPESGVHDSIYRDMSSQAYKKLIAKLSGNPHAERFNSFRIMRGSIARAAAAVAAHQTYFDLAVCWFTTRIGTIVIPMKDLRYINEGRSGYSFRSLLSHARRMLQSSEVKLLRFGALLGFLAMLLAVAATLSTLILKLFSPELVAVQGWTSVMVVVLFLGGLNAFLIGLVLEHLSFLIMQSHGKPTFFEIDRSQDESLRVWFQNQKSET